MQLQKMSVPTDVRFGKRFMAASDEQPLKAPAPIDVMFGGKSTAMSEEQF